MIVEDLYLRDSRANNFEFSKIDLLRELTRFVNWQRFDERLRAFRSRAPWYLTGMEKCLVNAARTRLDAYYNATR